MKKFLFIVVFLLSSKLLYGQLIVDLGAAYTYSSNNVNFDIHYQKSNNRFYLGLKFVPSTISKIDNNNVFKRTLNPDKLKESFGINFGYWRICYSNSQLKVFMFTDNQFIKSSYKPTFLFPSDGNNDSPEDLFVVRKEIFQPMPTFESYLGIGLLIELSEKLSFYQKIGSGMQVVTNIDKRILLEGKRTNYMLAPFMCNFGFNFQIN